MSEIEKALRKLVDELKKNYPDCNIRVTFTVSPKKPKS